MAENSKIGWTDHTWPIVQGCDYQDPGCSACYAVFDVWRQQNHPNQIAHGRLDGVVRKDDRGILSWTGKVACRDDRLAWPFRWNKPGMVFVPSLGDLFHEAVPDDFIDRVFAVMALTPHLTYQVLTRRSARMRAYLSDINRREKIIIAGVMLRQAGIHRLDCSEILLPLRNVWCGVSVPDQTWANRRIPDLLATPAAVRFVSYEPALEFVDFTRIEMEPLPSSHRRRTINALDGWVSVEETPGQWRSGPGGQRLDWIIIGGESMRRKNKQARPYDLDIPRRVIQDCRQYGVAVFHKQLGENPVLGGEPYAVTGKGTDMAEWPEDLRVQEFPWRQA